MEFEYKEIVPYLLHWFDYNARALPWRDHPVPYHVWISEIMLQQTRVEAVKNYFERFISELPDIEALAAVSEEKLLKLWEGLGYYSRVRNLKKAAVILIRDFNGELPADYDKLRSLPGIGAYTAGAIASIAYGIPVSAVDGNVLRVSMRLAEDDSDITKENTKKSLGSKLNAVIPKDRPGDFNQAIMELGATVCLPNGKPLCTSCPLMHLCNAFRHDTVIELPVKPVKKKRRVEDRTILLLEYQGKYAIRQRPDKGLLAGLWELPGTEGRLSLKQTEKLLRDLAIQSSQIEPMGKAKHIFTHVEWHMTGYLIRIGKMAEDFNGSSYLWADRDEIFHRYTLPNAFSVFKKYVN